MLGVPENSWEPCPSPLPNALDGRSCQRKGAGSPAAPIESQLGENPDEALAQQLQQEEQMDEAV